MGFLTGATKEPPEAETQARAQWHADNSLVSSWLIKAMTPDTHIRGQGAERPLDLLTAAQE